MGHPAWKRNPEQSLILGMTFRKRPVFDGKAASRRSDGKITQAAALRMWMKQSNPRTTRNCTSCKKCSGKTMGLPKHARLSGKKTLLGR